MAQSFAVDVNPAVLRWARESAGLDKAEVAARLQQPEATLSSWESGRKKPGWTVLRRLASFYKRPVPALLLPVPPEEPPLPPDFRTLPNARRMLSPKTRFAIRMARWFLQTAGELRQQLGVEQRFHPPHVRPSDDPERAAARAREALGVAIADQTEWRDERQAFKEWRRAIEAQDLFVFQFHLPLEELRGFSLFEGGLPAIVLNQSDVPAARVFTLFHEYAHLLLAHPGICLPEEGVPGRSPRIETSCNRFAAALLIPRADLEERLPDSPDEEAIRSLARRYGVSRYVVLGRLRTLRAVSSATYEKLFLRWQRQAPVCAAAPKKQKGGPKATVRCLSEKGRPFVSLVLQAVRREVITMNDAVAYLGTKLTDFRVLEAKVA